MSRCRLLLLLFLCSAAASTTAQPPFSGQADTFQVIHVYPHDANAFTQGLLYVDGHLYESTGLNGRSSIRMEDLSTGKVLQRYDLPTEYFGEGLTDWGSTLVQLSWKAHKGFVYDRFSFSLLRTFQYKGEGWGLTHDNKRLIMSDGTAELRFLDPKSFREMRRIRVTDETGHAVQNLNELEYIHGEIYANIWQTNMIVRISPRTGKILGWIDLRGIIDERELASPDAVLNGIAYDSAGDRLFVTGKLWPKLFEIRVTPHCRESTRPPRRRRAMLWHNDIMQIPQWLEWARRLQALGQNGLAYCKDPYDRKRYEEIRQLAIEMMAKGAGLSDSTPLAALFKNEEGYATPKIDIRAAVFDQERILLVKEREDGLWTLPGGWADVGDAPSFAAVREVKEESGYDIEIKKLAAVYDRDKHDHPPMAYHVYKFFFIGELCGGEAQNSLETSGVDFFGENDLPPLSVARVTPSQIEHMFVHHRNLALPTTFD